ncbi:MAG: endonuclease/exonuclease/phosphatase family protein [Paracoccaceae bacterium]
MSLSVATFNVKNLIGPGQSIYTSSKPAYTPEEFDQKTQWVGARIAEMEADVVGFQEVWSVDALQACLVAGGIEDEYELVARDAPSRSQVQVAYAVKTGILRGEPVWHENFPEDVRFRKGQTSQSTNHMDVRINNFSRPPLEIRIKPRRGAPEIVLFNAHLKSKRPIGLDSTDQRRLPSQDEIAIGSALATVRRAAEAAALRVLLNRRMLENDIPFVVLGDLNDDYLSVSTTIVTGDPSYKLFEASRVGSRASKLGDLGLYSVQMLKQYRSLRNVHYTHIFKNKLEVLDHILVSEQFYDHSPNRIWAYNDTRFWNDHLDDHGTTKLTSDHGIVLAEFDYKPIEKEIERAAAQIG